MKRRAVVTFGMAFGLALALNATACFAGEPPRDSHELTPEQLGDYSVTLKTTKPGEFSSPSSPSPPDLRLPNRNTATPYLGLSISRPLPDNFFNFGR